MSEHENEAEESLFKLDAETLQNPWPMFARMSAAGPVIPFGRDFFVTSHAACVSFLKDARFGRAAMLREEGTYALPMMFADPPDHTRLRAILNRAFTLRIVNALTPFIEQTTNELLDRVADRESFDVIASVAYKVPIHTICRLIGIPAADHDGIHELSEAHAADMSGDAEDMDAVHERATRLRARWAEYFRRLAEERRVSPREDIISGLVANQEGAEKLTEYELLATLMGILFAGHTTTADAIGTGLFALLSNRDQWELLVREPEHLAGAVEEVLRWEPPIFAYARVSLEDAEIAGVAIPKDVLVMALPGIANRDPAQFAAPDRFDITRKPNNHISFGGGIHFCLGSTLARVQIRTVLNALRERFPNLALKTERPVYRQTFGFRGLTRLDVTRG